MMKNLYRGEVFYLIASPLDHVEAYRYFEDGELAVVDGKIVEAGPVGGGGTGDAFPLPGFPGDRLFR